jgi:hypothetical protein
MKKFFLLAAAFVAMVATSCVTEDQSVVNANNSESLVSFTVEAPAPNMRAVTGSIYDDGTHAKHLTCAVYDADWLYLTTVNATFNDELKAVVKIRLVNNKKYNFVFWAEVEGNTHYTKNFGTTAGEPVTDPTVTVSYANAVANDVTRDAFFGKRFELLVNKTIEETIYLTRPFAQINFGANKTDVEAAVVGGFDMAKAQSEVTISAYNTLHFRGVLNSDYDVTGLEVVTFKSAAIPTVDLIAQDGNAYTWLAMNYILWPYDADSTSCETLGTCQMSITDTKDTASVVVKAGMAPANRNWRTNFLGNLLTDEVTFNVEILPVPENGFDQVIVPEGRE